MSAQPARSAPAVGDVLLYLVGVAGLAASITLVFLGMRAVMDVGGMCAEGGPYVIEQHCPEGTIPASLLGFLGGFAFVGLAGWKATAVGNGAMEVLFLAWPALFGVIGFNFLQYGLDPPGDDTGWAWGWLISGIVFELTAFGPLLLGLAAARVATPGSAGAAGERAVRATPGGPRIKAAVGDARRRRDVGRTLEPSVVPPGATDELSVDIATPTDSLVDGLERLAALHAAGSLTDDEYHRAKVELMDHPGR